MEQDQGVEAVNDRKRLLREQPFTAMTEHCSVMAFMDFTIEFWSTVSLLNFI
jgi:hypothetical protein